MPPAGRQVTRLQGRGTRKCGTQERGCARVEPNVNCCLQTYVPIPAEHCSKCAERGRAGVSVPCRLSLWRQAFLLLHKLDAHSHRCWSMDDGLNNRIARLEITSLAGRRETFAPGTEDPRRIGVEDGDCVALLDAEPDAAGIAGRCDNLHFYRHRTLVADNPDDAANNLDGNRAAVAGRAGPLPTAFAGPRTGTIRCGGCCLANDNARQDDGGNLHENGGHARSTLHAKQPRRA